MRKIKILCIAIVLIGVTTLSAGGYEDIYTLNLPYSYTYLVIGGAYTGDEAFQLDIDTSPADFSLDAGLDALYGYVKNSEDTYLSFNSSGTSVRAGSSGIFLNVGANGNYRSYAFNIDQMKAFLSVSGNANVAMNVAFSPSSSFFSLLLNPDIGFGVGRMYSIQETREVINTMEYFNIPVTEEKVKEVASLNFMRTQEYNTYNNDFNTVVSRYWNEKARILGIEDRIAELIWIESSQTYAFEEARWAGLEYGWTAYMEARPWIYYSSTSGIEFNIGIALAAEYATLMNDDSLYLSVSGDIVPTFSPSSTKIFSIAGDIDARVRYFFTDPRMWAEGNVNFSLNSLNTTTPVDLDISAEFDYLINPNFTAFAGARIVDTFDTIGVYAGGEMRLF